jgi:TonB family protein
VSLLRNVGMTRSAVLLTVILVHAVLLYAIIHAPPRRTFDGPPMFGPAVANKPVVEQAHPLRSRPWQPPPATEKSTYRVEEWHFPRVDIWPVTGEACPTTSEFGPLLDTQPEADEAQAPPRHAPPQSIPTSQKPRMVLWLRPAYPLDWARTEMEGTVRLRLKIRSTGATSEIKIQRGSGSQRLDVSAAEAAKSWRFAPERWQGQPIDSNATVELTFRFFEFSASRLGDESIATASRRGVRGTVPIDRGEVVRSLVEQLRTRATNVFVAPVNADGGPSWPTSMSDWGAVKRIQYLGAVGSPEWRRYKVSLKYQWAEPFDSVAVRWELYRVAHDNHAALWEVGLDRTGHVWAVKAESLEKLEHATKAAVVCKGNLPAPE